MNSKSIGNMYERQFSYQLSEWLTGEKNADVCWRDQGSGARFSTRKKQNKNTSQSGDIIPTDPKFIPFFNRFYIDTKSYKDINFLFINTVNQKSNDILQQWIKTCKDCPPNKIPIMPVKVRSRLPELIFMPVLTIVKYNNYMTYYFDTESGYDIYSCCMMLLSDFFELNNWEDFLKVNEKSS